MAQYLARRLAYLIAMAGIAASLAWLLASTQFNPRARYMGAQRTQPAYVIDSVLNSLNVNDKTPLHVRYGVWVSGVIRGDLGRTFENKSVSEQIGRRVWVSIRLLLVGTIVGCALAVILGARAADKHYSGFDHALTLFSLVTVATPVVVLASFLKIVAIGVNSLLGFQLLFTAGEVSPGMEALTPGGLANRAGHLVLPTILFVAVCVAVYSRYQRSSMLDVLASDYLRTARAKGLRREEVLRKHALRMAVLPMLPLFSYQFTLLFAGATFAENVFSWNGMGSYIVESIMKADVNALAGATVVLAILVVVAGFAADLLQAWLDPRIGLE